MSFTPMEDFSEIKAITYRTLLELVPTFVSLDISKESTGWVRYYDGILEHGSYSITADREDLVAVRREFRSFLLDVFGDRDIQYLFIEDIIGSVNFKTARILYQLNAIPDDMVDLGLIKADTIIREDNKVWKKYLKLASGYVGKVQGEKNDKQMIRDCMLLLGFGDGTTDSIKEDIYDAYGLAVASIYKRFVVKEEKQKVRVKNDIARGYVVKQFGDEYEALDLANDLGLEIVNLDFTQINRDLKHNMKKQIKTVEDEMNVYMVKILTCKIGALALDKRFDLGLDVSYLVIYRK